MIAKRYVTPTAHRRGAVLAVLLTVAVALWLSIQPTAEGRLTDGTLPDDVELATPVGFAVSSSADNPDTAFREDEAGFSAYYRVTETKVVNEQGKGLFLNIKGITENLATEPDAHLPDPSNGIRGKGIVQDYGLNFGIVALPMVAAVGVNVPLQDVNVYYDDEGWIVAYLTCEPASDEQDKPNCEPAASMWKHDQELEQNLLLLAVNEVISANNQAAESNGDGWTQLNSVTHETVRYYDWQEPDCNAFVIFSAKSGGGASNPVKFVIPPTIETGDIQASAAALITRQQADGAQTEASVEVDGTALVTVKAPVLLDARSFDLDRTDGETSLHDMTVSVSEGEPATGVVMLVYKKPEATND